jgi:hypothetical protein
MATVQFRRDNPEGSHPGKQADVEDIALLPLLTWMYRMDRIALILFIHVYSPFRS